MTIPGSVEYQSLLPQINDIIFRRVVSWMFSESNGADRFKSARSPAQRVKQREHEWYPLVLYERIHGREAPVVREMG